MSTTPRPARSPLGGAPAPRPAALTERPARSSSGAFQAGIASDDYVAFCERVRQGLEQADFGHKRELLELLIDRVIVTDETVEIRYAIPVGPEGEREPFCLLRTDYQGRFSGPRDR